MDKKWHTDATTIAECFGITARRVQQLVRSKPQFQDCKIGHGSYDFYKFASRYADYMKQLGDENDDDENGLNPRHERARKDKEQADKIALENSQTRKDLIRTSDVVQFLAHIQVLYNTQFENFKGRLTARLVTVCHISADKILEILNPEIYSSRDITAKELSDYGENLTDDSRSD